MIEDGIKLVINAENDANRKIKEAKGLKAHAIQKAEADALKQEAQLRKKYEAELEKQKIKDLKYLEDLKFTLYDEYNAKLEKMNEIDCTEIIDIIANYVAGTNTIDQNDTCLCTNAIKKVL